MTPTSTSQRPTRPAAADTLVVPHQVWKGKLDWRVLLDWLRDDKLISADDGERVVRRFGAGSSSQHPLVRLGAAGSAARRHTTDAGHRGPDRMAGAALQDALPAHRPAEGRCRPRRRCHVGALRREPLRAAGADEQRRGGDRHQRALRSGLGDRDRGAHAARRQAGAGQPAGRAQVHHRVLCAGQIGARGAEERRGLARGQLRAAGRTGQDRQAAGRQRPGRGAGGRLAVAVRLRPARQRHPPGAAARHGRHPLPHRRRAAHGVPGAAGRDERDDLAHQAARPHGRGRAPPPARTGASRPSARTRWTRSAPRSRCGCRRCPRPSARSW